MNISKRYFLKLLSASTMMPLLMGQNIYADNEDDTYQQFKKNHKKDKRLSGFLGVQKNFPNIKLEVTGKIPSELYGTFYRNGPAKNEFNHSRYHHWFDGDGMIQGFQLSQHGISHQGKFITTEKYKQELAHGDFFINGSGTNWNGSPAIKNPDMMNTANISFVWHGNELLALWEGGSAHRINPDNLDTLGLKVWRDDLKNLPFSAHPRQDENGDLWNFGSAPWIGKLLIYRVNKNGELAQFGIADINADAMIHDFAITKDYLIFIMPPFRWQKNAEIHNFVDGFKWHPNQASRLIILDKNDFSLVWQGETETGFHFHIGNAYQHKNDIILDFFQSSDAKIVQEWMRGIMKGEFYDLGNSVANHQLLQINLHSKQVKMTKFSTASAEFPTISSHKIGRKNRYCWLLESDKDNDLFNRVTKRDMMNGHTDFYDYGKDVFAEEHIFISKKDDVKKEEAKKEEAKKEEGWLIGTAFDSKKQQSLLSIFDAQNLHNGPIAQATLPYILPLGFHGTFIPQNQLT